MSGAAKLDAQSADAALVDPVPEAEPEPQQNPAVPHPVGNTYLLGGPLETSTAEIGQSPLSSYIALPHHIRFKLTWKTDREQLARVPKAFTSR